MESVDMSRIAILWQPEGKGREGVRGDMWGWDYEFSDYRYVLFGLVSYICLFLHISATVTPFMTHWVDTRGEESFKGIFRAPMDRVSRVSNCTFHDETQSRSGFLSFRVVDNAFL